METNVLEEVLRFVETERSDVALMPCLRIIGNCVAG